MFLTPLRATSFRAALLTTASVLALTACSDDGGSDEAQPEDPAARLEAAADLLDGTSGVSFALEGSDLPDSGTVILGGEGVAAPPDALEGEIRLLFSGLPTTIPVVSVGGELYANILGSGFAPVDADTLGFSDPAALIDPERGVSQLLRSGSDVTAGDEVRVDSEVYDQVTSTLPGELVDQVLALADPAAEVEATWAIDPDTGQLRQATLTGPFYDTGSNQTYTVTLGDYDEPVEISAPAD
jgi:lipoprotein LprG